MAKRVFTFYSCMHFYQTLADIINIVMDIFYRFPGSQSGMCLTLNSGAQFVTYFATLRSIVHLV